MKTYFIFLVLLITSSLEVLSQERKLKLAYVDSMDYYLQDGISYQLLNHTDYTTDTLRSSSWLYLTKIKSTKIDTLRKKISVTNNDTVRVSINFKKYDSNFNLVLEVDSVNEQLTRKLANEFTDNKLVESSEFNLQFSYSGDGTGEYARPISKTTRYFYHENEKLYFKTIEIVIGSYFFFASGSKPDTIVSYYEYNVDGRPIKSIVLEDGDTTITHSEYNANGNLTMKETKSPYAAYYSSNEYDDNQRIVKSVFQTNDHIEMIEERIFDESGNLIVKTYEGKFSSSKIVHTFNLKGEIIIRMTYESK